MVGPAAPKSVTSRPVDPRLVRAIRPARASSTRHADTSRGFEPSGYLEGCALAPLVIQSMFQERFELWVRLLEVTKQLHCRRIPIGLDVMTMG